MSLEERLGPSLRRSPYLWLAITLLLYLVMASSLAGIAKDSRHASTALAVVAAAVIAYMVVAAVLMPRLVLGRARIPPTLSRVALLRWAFATAPFMVGFAAVTAGGQQWALAMGTVASAGLLVAAARAVSKAERSDA